MIYLQCTRNVRKQLGLDGQELRAAPEGVSALGNWTLNRIPLGDRSAFLFMSDRSLLSFPILEGRQGVEMAGIPGLLAHGITQLMQMVGVRPDAYAKLLRDTEEIAVTKSGNRSLLANHNAIAADYIHRVDYAGGIPHCNLGEIIRDVNQTPRSKLKWATSFEVTLDLLHQHAA